AVAAADCGEAVRQRTEVNIQDGPRHHANPRGDEIIAQRDSRQAEGVIHQIEREDRGEPRQQHDLPTFARDGVVNGFEFVVPGNFRGDPGAGEVTSDQEGACRAERGADGDTYKAELEAEQESATEGQQGTGDKENTGDDVN